MTKVYTISKEATGVSSYNENSRRQEICPEIEEEYINRLSDYTIRNQLFENIFHIVSTQYSSLKNRSTFAAIVTDRQE